MRLTIEPEPTPDEETAILAVLLLRHSGREIDRADENVEAVSRWARAGRLQAHRREPASSRRSSNTSGWKGY